MTRKWCTYRSAAVALLGATMLAGPAMAQQYPLQALPDDGERDFWWYHQVVEEDVLAAMQDVVGAPGTP
ncbi:MAG: hypothetical protein ACFCVH_21165, partial [Alphaproteobacteria bacterium]